MDCVDVADELHAETTDDNTPATACAKEVVMSVSESPSDDDEEIACVDSGNSDNDNGLLTGNSMPLIRFKPSEEDYTSLLAVKQNVVLQEIPRERKVNCFCCC